MIWYTRDEMKTHTSWKIMKSRIKKRRKRKYSPSPFVEMWRRLFIVLWNFKLKNIPFYNDTEFIVDSSWKSFNIFHYSQLFFYCHRTFRFSNPTKISTQLNIQSIVNRLTLHGTTENHFLANEQHPVMETIY